MAFPETSSPFDSLQKAVVTRLGANSNTSSYTVYDEGAVPQTATFPYIAITRVSGLPEFTNSTTAQDVRIEIRCLDRFEKGMATRGTMYEMMSDVTKALSTSDIDPAGDDWNLYDQRLDFSEVLPFEDDTHIFYEGILRFRYRMQYLG